jgi:hypothetical protein
MAFYNLEPFGDERDDLRMGILASTIANGFTQGRGNFTPDDFKPQFGPRQQDVSTMQAILMAASTHGAAAKEQAQAEAARLRKKKS